MEQALSFSSRAEDASDVQVPAKDASVHNLNEGCIMPSQYTAEREKVEAIILGGTLYSTEHFQYRDLSGHFADPSLVCVIASANAEFVYAIALGTENVELVDSISPVNPASIVDDQLPSLLSLVIDGLPPLQQSKYVPEAEKRLHHYVERHHNVYALDSCCRAGLSSAGYMHPGVISVDRLVEISFSYALMFLLDDLFFDTPDEFHQDQYGVSLSSCGSPQKIQEYLEHLDAVFSQQVQPRNPTPLIETLMWESGQNMLKLSNPEWFNHYVAKLVEHHRGSIASYADILQGRNTYFKGLESYAVMRVRNIGANFVQLAVEFAKDSYIPGMLRATPYFENVTTTTAIHLAFVNDIFSYHKESTFEQNPRNLITVLMECEGKPFVETVHKAIGLLNTYACVVVDFEAKAWNSTLRNHLEDIKSLMAGNIYYSFIDKRYRHPNSTFPELRDMTSMWKMIPHAKGSRL